MNDQTADQERVPGLSPLVRNITVLMRQGAPGATVYSRCREGMMPCDSITLGSDISEAMAYRLVLTHLDARLVASPTVRSFVAALLSNEGVPVSRRPLVNLQDQLAAHYVSRADVHRTSRLLFIIDEAQHLSTDHQSVLHHLRLLLQLRGLELFVLSVEPPAPRFARRYRATSGVHRSLLAAYVEWLSGKGADGQP